MDFRSIQVLNERVHHELRERRELGKITSRGRSLFISWADGPSTGQDRTSKILDEILRDDYHYVLDTLLLAGSRESDLLLKISDLLDQAEVSHRPAVIYYYGAVESGIGKFDWVSRSRQDRVPWSRLQSLLQQSRADVLLFIDRQRQPCSRDDGYTMANLSSLMTSLPLDTVQGKLEVICSECATFAGTTSFISQISIALGKRQSGGLAAHDLAIQLRQAVESGNLTYDNLSSQDEGRSIVLACVPRPRTPITFTFDIFVTKSSNGSDLSEELYCWFLTSPPATRDMCLLRHKDVDLQQTDDSEFTNLLSLHVESWEQDSTISKFTQWTKRAPDKVLVTPRSAPALTLHQTKSPQAVDQLTSWVEQRNRVTELMAVSSTRQGEYSKVVVLPIRWADSDWNATQEIQLLRSAFEDHFNYQVRPDLVLPSNDNAQSEVESHFNAYTEPGSTNALTSKDLLIAVYNGHGADGFKHKGEMILEPGESPRTASVNWTNIARSLNKADCDVLQIMDCCFAATATKARRERQSIDTIFNSIYSSTSKSEYLGKNEILASSSRDSEAHANDYASTHIFAKILRDLAEARQPFTVEKWWHRIDTMVAKAWEIPSSSGSRTESGFSTPFRKIHPETMLGRSIVLKPKDTKPLQQQGTRADGYVYAKIKLIQGDERETLYLTEDQVRRELSSCVEN